MWKTLNLYSFCPVHDCCIYVEIGWFSYVLYLFSYDIIYLYINNIHLCIFPDFFFFLNCINVVGQNSLIITCLIFCPFQCSNHTCCVAYHPLCARAAGLCVEVVDFFSFYLHHWFYVTLYFFSIICWMHCWMILIDFLPEVVLNYLLFVFVFYIYYYEAWGWGQTTSTICRRWWSRAVHSSSFLLQEA